MIDPLHSLAFSVQANPGVYAVLLGSGVSRSAKIPTGWEITLELVRKVATLHGEECESNPSEWHRAKFGCEPDYSKLLDEVAKTPAERQQLLHRYFEATEDEQEEGLKQPTEAHKAIASLVVDGFIKVIITTNFDRLMERALVEAGVTPTIISSVDHIKGALPLVHTNSCIVKVHGDYKDTRILNTPSELASYSDEMNAYLDRIFDEFGLIVCGWSAEWDEALRNAILRAPNRRFSTYWASMGEPRAFAKDLVQHRGAHSISINGADNFFQSLSELVKSLETYARPHPLSTEAAVASLKRYMAEDRFRIKFVDLIVDEVERVHVETRGDRFSTQAGPEPNGDALGNRIKAIEAACSTLISLSVVGGEWSEEQHFKVWERAIERLTVTPIANGYYAWIALQRYPAILLLYTLGISAILSGRFQLLQRLLTRRIRNWDGEDSPVIRLLPPYWISERGSEIWQPLYDNERRHAPLNDWIFKTLRPYLLRLIPDDHSYEIAFDRFEICFALAYAIHAERGDDWVPPGAFGYRHRNRDQIIKELKESVERFGTKSPFISSGLFGYSLPDADRAFLALQNSVSHLHWR